MIEPRPSPQNKMTRRFRWNLRQFLAQRRPPATVVEHGLQRLVDGRDALVVALLEAYSVDLVAEEGAGDLELAPVLWLGREAGQDRVVGRDGLNLLAKRLVDTVAVAEKPDQVDLGPVQRLDPVARRGALAVGWSTLSCPSGRRAC